MWGRENIRGGVRSEVGVACGLGEVGLCGVELNGVGQAALEQGDVGERAQGVSAGGVVLGDRAEGAAGVRGRIGEVAAEASAGGSREDDGEQRVLRGRNASSGGPGAQTFDNDLGKIIRITSDGAAPPDNPFVKKAGARPEIWSYGHRNPQGLAINPADGKLWEQEHGAKGGDEINLIVAGHNYGWPLVSHGVNYDGSPVGTGKATMAGVDDPLWTGRRRSHRPAWLFTRAIFFPPGKATCSTAR